MLKRRRKKANKKARVLKNGPKGKNQACCLTFSWRSLCASVQRNSFEPGGHFSRLTNNSFNRSWLPRDQMAYISSRMFRSTLGGTVFNRSATQGYKLAAATFFLQRYNIPYFRHFFDLLKVKKQPIYATASQTYLHLFTIITPVVVKNRRKQ